MKSRRVLAGVLVIAFVLAVSGTALASVPTDVYKEKIEELQISDVEPDDWAAGSIINLYEAGILSTNPEGTFRPEAEATTEEAIAVVARALGIATKSDSLEVTMQRAATAGLITTTQQTEAKDEISRLDMALVLAKALNVTPKTGVTLANAPFKDAANVPQSEWGTLAALYDLGVFRGYPDGTFNAGGMLTRAEMAELVTRILSRVTK